jgi:hypothetical protein
MRGVESLGAIGRGRSPVAIRGTESLGRGGGRGGTHEGLENSEVVLRSGASGSGAIGGSVFRKKGNAAAFARAREGRLSPT